VDIPSLFDIKLIWEKYFKFIKYSRIFWIEQGHLKIQKKEFFGTFKFLKFFWNFENFWMFLNYFKLSSTSLISVLKFCLFLELQKKNLNSQIIANFLEFFSEKFLEFPQTFLVIQQHHHKKITQHSILFQQIIIQHSKPLK